MHTTKAPAEPTLAVTVPAHRLALGWLNAFSAASKDKDRPALYQTLSIEIFERGVQMVATDGAVLIRTFASSWLSGPELEEAPIRSFVVRDQEGFGKGFMATLFAAANDAEQTTLAELAIEPADEDAAPALGAEFQKERLVVRVLGQRMDLPLYEATYPDWRRLNLGLDARERVPGLTFSPRILATVGKLKGVDHVDLEFVGQERAVFFTANGDMEVHGVMMPMRRRDPEA